MAKWRVWLDTETKSYLDVEAETKREVDNRKIERRFEYGCEF